MSDHSKPVPHDLVAERAVLGAIMQDNRLLVPAVGIISESDFYRDAHTKTWRAICALNTAGSGIDSITLRDRCAADGVLDEVGGPAYIASLTDGIPRSMHVEHYAAIVREKSRLRRLITECERIQQAAWGEAETAVELIAGAERSMMELARDTVATGFQPMDSIMSQVLDSIDAAQARRGETLGVPTGLADVDNMLHGLLPGKLITLAARPGVGKSAFAMGAATNAALQGRRVAVFSLEMDAVELGRRQLAAHAGVDGHRIAGGWLNQTDYGRIAHSAGVLSELPMVVTDVPTVNLFNIRAQCFRQQSEHGLDLVVIDYLQLVSTVKQQNREREVSELTKGFKILSRELKVPVLMLAQMNRAVESRGGKPQLSDLRESGSIEQDSDVVMFLHRDENPQDGDPAGTTELVIRKHRGGPIGSVKLAWFPTETRFANFSGASV